VSKKLLSYDPGYVRGETCLLKWQEGDGPMPENPVPCRRPAVARAASRHGDSKLLKLGDGAPKRKAAN